jgi:anti-sigma factor RsiW
MTSDRPEESADMTSPTHPDPETLERFVLGRLDRRAMARVEAHLGGCSSCGRAAMHVPDDRLVALLRTRPAAGRSPDGATKSA